MAPSIELIQIYENETPESGSLIPALPDLPCVNPDHVLSDMFGGNAPRISLQDELLAWPGLLWLTQMCCYRCMDEAISQAEERQVLPEGAVLFNWTSFRNEEVPDVDDLAYEVYEMYPEACVVVMNVVFAESVEAESALRKLDASAVTRYHMMRNQHHYQTW